MARNLADLIPAVFTGPNGQPLTEDQIRSRQLIARSLLQNATDTSPTAGGWASVLSKGVQGFAAGYQNRSADRGAQAASKADSDLSAALLGSYAGTDTSIPTPSASGEIAATSPAVTSNSTLPPSFLAVLDKTEGGGGYDTLFGNAQKGQFAGTDVSKMPISDVLAFTDPSGPYAQSVKSQIGRVATPVGRHQIVGTTLRNAVGALGLDPNTPFSPETQDKVALYLAKQRIASSDTPQGKIAALRNEWEGLRRVPDNQLLQVVSDIENYQPTQVASAAPQTATDAIAAVSPPSGYVDPQVTTAYQAPIPVTSAPIAPVGQAQTVSDPTVAPAQDISPVAQALVAPMKGDRLGATTSQNFSDRFGSSAPEQAAPEIYSQPGDFAAPQQAAPAAPVAPISLPQPQLPTVQPLNPAVIKALSSPYASPQTKAVAESLLKQNMAQRQAVEEQRLKIQQQQQALQQRQAVAQSLGIDPTLAGDDEAWKQAVGGGSLINAGDGNLYDSRTRQWITAPNSGNKNFRQATPEEVKIYGTNGQVGPDGKFYPITPPQGTSLSVDPNTGAVSFNQGAGVKPLTEGQSKDTFFNTRMEAALPTLEANENALLNLGGKVADAIPMNLGNYAQSEDYQLARDAGRDFVTAYLRKDSGAAITPQEEKVYGELLLPQPGDKPSAIEAKRQRRRVAIEAIKAGMPQQALDNALKAIKASGGDKAIVPTEIPGVTIRRVN